jgi:hypothetical protein
MSPEKFPDNPFDPVSPYYPLELTMNTDAESVALFVVRGENETEVIPLNSLSSFIRQAVILRFRQEKGFWKRKLFHGAAPTVLALLRSA